MEEKQAEKSEIEKVTRIGQEQRERWEEICEDYRSSGRTAKLYSEEQGFPEHRLKYWLKKFSRERLAGGEFVEMKLPIKPEAGRYKVVLNNGNGVELGGNFQVARVKELLECIR